MCIDSSKFGSVSTRRNTSNNSNSNNTSNHKNNSTNGTENGIHASACNSNVMNASTTTTTNTTTNALRRMTPMILSGYLFNTIAYFAIVYAPFPPSVSFVTHSEFCNNEHECARRDLFAFQVVSFINLSYLGLLGTYAFFFSKHRTVWWCGKKKNDDVSASTSFSTGLLLPPTPQGRYFGRLSEADSINAGIVIFQGWDFVASLFFDEHCTAVMMMHHLLAFICGFFCLVYEVAPYYAVYFGGVSEFSSIFLCLAQVFEFYPPSSLVSSDSTVLNILPKFIMFSQAMFVVTFFVFRIAGWIFMSYKFISDGSFIIKHKLCNIYSPSSWWFLWYLLATSILLGTLQVYWFREIMNKVLDML